VYHSRPEDNFGSGTSRDVLVFHDLGQLERQIHQGRQHMHGGVHRRNTEAGSAYLKGINKDPQLWDDWKWSRLYMLARQGAATTIFPK
jgi:hypothetical protein